MDYLGSILTTLIIISVLPILFSVMWGLKAKEEKKLPSDGVIKTRAHKALLGFFLGFGLLVLLGGAAGIIYCAIADSENTTIGIVVVFSLCVAAFSAIGFFGFAIARFNYVVADGEGVLVHRLFKKSISYRYDEIDRFQDSVALGIMGGLVGYDKNSKKIFSVDAMQIGGSAVARRLREHGVAESNSGSTRL